MRNSSLDWRHCVNPAATSFANEVDSLFPCMFFLNLLSKHVRNLSHIDCFDECIHIR